MTQSTEQRGGNAAKPPREGRPRLRDKTVTITLGLPKAVFGVLFSLFVLVWVFIFGIMLGRGHNPEEVVPELAKVMPAPSNNSPAPPPLEEVLQQRDLKYHDSLKGKNAAQPPRASAPTPVRQPAAPVTPAPKPAAAKPVERPKPTTVKPATVKLNEKKQPETAKQDQTVYNYVYQVAAFNNARQAQAMQQQLRSNGIFARVSETRANNTLWFRMLVDFKGRPEDTRILREKLAAQGITSVLLRGKTPAK